ncbi:unnamed protein product [Sphenostylis stenocarpa]|uniref:Uncharacterized protein n=1 Tax=Sphenostylis stenocarpa TaxID=92480 RepID=A0AA86VD58_9FABA|nr:unnamed protein product [Sphenostylis stenocarpa]
MVEEEVGGSRSTRIHQQTSLLQGARMCDGEGGGANSNSDFPLALQDHLRATREGGSPHMLELTTPHQQ